MAARNRTERSLVRSAGRPWAAAVENRKNRGKKVGTAMVPARFLTETPEYAKAIVGRWGKVICFKDSGPFLF